MRTDDIVEFVADGVADLGITGTNLLVESGVDLATLTELGYGHCRLEVAVPNASTVADVRGRSTGSAWRRAIPGPPRRPSRGSASRSTS